jgi:hypothetical protein
MGELTLPGCGDQHSRWIARRVAIAVLSLTLVSLDGMHARADQIILNASVDANLADNNGDGTFDQINADSPALTGLAMQNFVNFLPPSVNFEKRAIVEFDNSVLPSNAIIQSVDYTFQVTSFTDNASHAGVFAYAGTGAISLADGSASAAQVGSYNAISLSVLQISLDKSVFQSLLGSTGFFALRLQALEQANSTQIGSIEQSVSFTPPTLTITYTTSAVPEPSGLVLGCISTASLAGLTMCRGRSKKTRSSRG